MKITTVLGARPQFNKAAILSTLFRKETSVKERIIHTGQHYDHKMSEVFFEEMNIPKPDYFLNVTSKYHGEMTGRMLEGVEKILLEEKPDIVLVYGDTNSTLAGALAASKLHIPLAHVEAGLRSFNKKMPEEVNRILTDHVSDWLFVPTLKAKHNLKAEGFNETQIHDVGDIMLDAVLHYQQVAADKSTIIKDLELNENEYILTTIHRAENTNDPHRLHTIFDQLSTVSKDKMIVLPVHPRTKSFLKKDYQTKNFKLIEPVGYFDMLLLLKYCRLVLTDSGGVQKEAYFNKKYCITIREETEWIELVQNHVNFLAKAGDSIPLLVNDLWDKTFNENRLQLYGNGEAARKIAGILMS
jgi:UDP-GlcNAc3NAcA epimerase